MNIAVEPDYSALRKVTNGWILQCFVEITVLLYFEERTALSERNISI